MTVHELEQLVFVMHAELLVDVHDVRPRRTIGNHERVGDVLCIPPARQISEHFPLPSREPMLGSHLITCVEEHVMDVFFCLLTFTGIRLRLFTLSDEGHDAQQHYDGKRGDDHDIPYRRIHDTRKDGQCKIADGLTLDDLKFTDINPKAIEDREAPNVGNDPVLSDEAHKGVPNKASYTIDALGDVKYSDTSNTVTVKPVTDREGDYGPEGDEDEGNVKDKDDNPGKVKGKGTRTGDTTPVGMLIALLIAAEAALVTMIIRRRKFNR